MNIFEIYPILVPCLIAIWLISFILISLVFFYEIKGRGRYKASDIWTHVIMLINAPIALILLLGYIIIDKAGDKRIWENKKHKIERERAEHGVYS
jgi:hypothetical protein